MSMSSLLEQQHQQQLPLPTMPYHLQQQQQQPQQQPLMMMAGSRHCCLSSQETAQQVPTTDLARVSFYLRCCILGCGLLANNNNNNNNSSNFPMELLIDFTRAHTLPLEWQTMIYRLAFEEFGLCNLLGRVIHVDNNGNNGNNGNNRVLPAGISTLFLQVNSPEYIIAMNRLGVTITPASLLSLSSSSYVMICSSEWIETHHILPFQRYIGNLSCFLDEQQLQQQQQQLMQQQQLQQQQQQVPQQSSSSSSSSSKKVEATVHFDYIGAAEIGDDDFQIYDDNIPMVAAIPLESRHDEVSSSLIVPGQEVRLFGLETEEMNDAVGIVQERKDNRVIVRVPNHQCKYSVRIENLIIVQEGIPIVNASAVVMEE